MPGFVSGFAEQRLAVHTSTGVTPEDTVCHAAGHVEKDQDPPREEERAWSKSSPAFDREGMCKAGLNVE